MSIRLGHVSIFVNDLDEAKIFYTDKLGFVVETDQKLPNGYRWISVLPEKDAATGIVFILADNAIGRSAVGKQAPERVLFTIKTEDCDRDYNRFVKNGIVFESSIREMPYGKDAVFADLYGNRIDLVETKKP
jgi:catechol 2,3-dioxygenase-like lactoylglutathione lyase family enzyme